MTVALFEAARSYLFTVVVKAVIVAAFRLVLSHLVKFALILQVQELGTVCKQLLHVLARFGAGFSRIMDAVHLFKF